LWTVEEEAEELHWFCFFFVTSSRIEYERGRRNRRRGGESTGPQEKLVIWQQRAAKREKGRGRWEMRKCIGLVLQQRAAKGEREGGGGRGSSREASDNTKGREGERKIREEKE
jgi:hypothetical protein